MGTLCYLPFTIAARFFSLLVARFLWLPKSTRKTSIFPPRTNRSTPEYTRKWPCGHLVTDHDPDVIDLDKENIPRCHWLTRKQSPMMSLLHYLTFSFEISPCTKMNSHTWLYNAAALPASRLRSACLMALLFWPTVYQQLNKPLKLCLEETCDE